MAKHFDVLIRNRKKFFETKANAKNSLKHCFIPNSKIDCIHTGVKLDKLKFYRAKANAKMINNEQPK